MMYKDASVFLQHKKANLKNCSLIILKLMIILLDFDGTVCEHEYPEIGADIGAVPVLKKLVQTGNKLILWTMRDGPELLLAIEWFATNGIKLYAANHNPTQKHWTTSPKAHGHLVIDDTGICVPLIHPGPNRRPYVDWNKIEDELLRRSII